MVMGTEHVYQKNPEVGQHKKVGVLEAENREGTSVRSKKTRSPETNSNYFLQVPE